MSGYNFVLGKMIKDRIKECDKMIETRLTAIAGAKDITVKELKKIIREADKPMDQDELWDYLDSLEDQGLLGKGEE